MLIFDHIAVAGRDLASVSAWVETQLDVTLQPGGKHALFGTHNRLLGLGDIYLEVIARDPDAPSDRPAWFNLDHFAGQPKPVNWICRKDDLRTAPHVAGPPVSLERGDLRWQITVPEDGSLPYDGAYPTLIKWAPGTVHPTSRLPDSGVRLMWWQISHPQADSIAAMVQIADARISFITGPVGFRATFETPNGLRVLM